MLQFNRLILCNVGPYKDTETIDFPGDGVTLVRGENMRGKTTLLNGFRFALFGTVLTRAMRPLPYRDLINWESASAGNHKATVELHFTGDGHEYRLTRTIEAKSGVPKPTADADYFQRCFLERDGLMLNEAQTTHQLSVLMPEKISRFSLFDGELLQQYEELLRKESQMGQEIAEAIETILGVPVLKKGRSVLETLVKEAQVTEGAAARKNKSTNELGVTYSQLGAECQALAEERARYIVEQDTLQQRQRAAEEVIQRNEQGAKLMDEMKRLTAEVAALKERLTAQQGALKREMADAWKWVATPRVTDTLAHIRKELNRARTAQMQILWGKGLLDTLQASVILSECGACGQPLNSAALQRVADKLESMQGAGGPNDPTLVVRLTKVEEALSPFQAADRLAIVDSMRSQIDATRIEINDKESRIHEIDAEELAKVDQAEILDARDDLRTSTKELGVVESQTKALEDQIARKQTDISKLQQQLASAAGTDEKLAKEQRKRELLQTLHALFDDGVKLYKHRLRARVEKDASELFRAMTSEADYKGLRINDHYGLTIVHKDDTAVAVRSSGAEHVVALSLMGALQRNAPMRGPVVMDSPFGRLDDTHKTNIVMALPKLANQVMLLVFEAELNPARAQALLGAKLKAQYSLERISARHTQVRKV